jgi:Tfp pilus assembly protein PilV
MKKFSVAALLVSVCMLAVAKLPALDDAAKAKAAETAAKTAWSAKVDGFKLCKAQDKSAASYYKTAKASGKPTPPAAPTPPCADPGPFVYQPA